MIFIFPCFLFEFIHVGNEVFELFFKLGVLASVSIGHVVEFDFQRQHRFPEHDSRMIFILVLFCTLVWSGIFTVGSGGKGPRLGVGDDYG